MHIHQLVQQYGAFFYPLVFAWTFLEGESIVILSGAGVRHGLVDIRPLIAAAWLGSFMGDQLWFFLSRRYGSWMLRRYPKAAAKIARASEMLARHATLFIFSYRFIYGVRNVASLAIGASSISWRRFALLNFVSAGVWACCFSYGGYLLGTALKQVMDNVADWLAVGLAAGIVSACAAWAVTAWRRRRTASLLRQSPPAG